MLIWKVTRRGYCVGDIKRLSGIYSGNIKFNNLIIFLSPFNRVKNIISDKKKKKNKMRNMINMASALNIVY